MCVSISLLMLCISFVVKVVFLFFGFLVICWVRFVVSIDFLCSLFRLKFMSLLVFLVLNMWVVRIRFLRLLRFR